MAELGLIQNPTELPDLAPGNWLLAHVDVETTGLVPGYHEMIDIGLVYTDLDGKLIDSLWRDEKRPGLSRSVAISGRDE